jgi:hypothetical protein
VRTKGSVKVFRTLKTSDILTIIGSLLEEVQTEEGQKFEHFFSDETTMTVKVGTQLFVLTAQVKDKFN